MSLERIEHVLIVSTPQTGEAANTTLRINRFDGYEYDWNDGTFKAAGTATTPEQAATEYDATNDPGAYYWNIGTGSTVDGVLPAAFNSDGMYRFSVTNSSLGYYQTWGVQIIRRREAVRYPGDRLKAKKVLSTAASGNLTLYESDGSTVMEQATVKDVDGGAITLSPGVPARETPA